jgi:hypothetical protein
MAMTTANTSGTTTSAATSTSWNRRLRAGLAAIPLLGAVALLPGCFESSSCLDGNIRATWSLQTPNGQIVECAIGDTVEMQVDIDMTVSFPCGDHVGVSPPLAAGTTHAVSMALFDAGHQELAHTDPITVGVSCGGVVTTPAVVFPVAAAVPPVCGPGMLQASWFLTSNNQTVECAPGDEVDMRVDTDGMTVTFPCSDHGGLSPEVTGGVSHDVSFTLFDSAGHVLSQTSHMSILVPCNTTKATPQVEFSLTP